MADLPIAETDEDAVPIHAIRPGELEQKAAAISPQAAAWAKSSGFTASASQVCMVPDSTGNLAAVLTGRSENSAPMDAGTLAKLLPAGRYHLASGFTDPALAALGWMLGAYKFDRYRSYAAEPARLVMPDTVDEARLSIIANSVYLVRDLVNTPANDMGPAAIETAVRQLAKHHHAKVSVIAGDDLLKENLPMIHAVGRASCEAPRLIDLSWGSNKAPKVTLVGKGVSFDTGGLNIKSGSSMALMKKDMGGAANVLGLAAMIMAAKLDIRLRVLVPAVENAIAGNAFRPGDVLPSRKGLTVEIGNTDAEGRLVLGDALALAGEEKPQLLVDMATLTGAARVALGSDLAPFYTGDDTLAHNLATAAGRTADPVWRMPLWAPYDAMLSSRIADVNHISKGGFAGSITAALFLARFVDQPEQWMHFDIFAWVPDEKPWAPAGGEAQAVRALFEMIETNMRG